MAYIISGIQQIGVGIPNLEAAWLWYRCRFGLDIPIFREAAEAPFMIAYTANEIQSRDALLAINLRGGGGLEIWQYTSRPTTFPKKLPILGDLGIFAARIKTSNLVAAHRFLVDSGVTVLGSPEIAPDGRTTFFVRDSWGNLFQIVHSDSWFKSKGHPTGGVAGALIGVSDIDAAFPLYRDLLGYDRIEFDEIGVFPDWSPLNGGGGEFRRVLLSSHKKQAGPFGALLGSSSIELVQSLKRKPKKIFADRLWGDAGFIHLCFDIQGMDALGTELNSKGFDFTVDSCTSFDMGDAAGRFTYIEDPDGTLIEFVETYRIPIVKKLGWFVNLTTRRRGAGLPAYMIKALALNRVRSNCDSL
ncbi:hypothetical protein S1OALGB6SA_1141 [Olavius algarvensis spirochete endosymbiont]|uniref:VOC family protein n=1 Tax=Olavius algarvensis spirochete endosymbiont TaxID=260710 RepID=UPI00052DB915|nr:VOC family protein [Olavius algarvensis spirochete endosymbiont]KGM38526.1 glyoxalase [Alkalispirochaeta odontotermitis]VDB00068.1 hypothetical protein S1OALGB6SA_1141 [Olavius algarvensis spirochete endosymbiont]